MKTLFKSISNFAQKAWKSLRAQPAARGPKSTPASKKRARKSTRQTGDRVIITKVTRVSKPSQKQPSSRKVPALSSTIFSILLILILVIAAFSARGESVWLNAGAKAGWQYADHLARRPGDILTIVINENTNNIVTKETKADKTSTNSDSIANWFLGSANPKPRTLNMNGDNEYDGKGNITDQEQIQANIAVMVTDILPNGNLLVEGVRSVEYSGEKQYIILQGMVRPDDVAANNTVQSTQVANATITLKDEGDLASAQKKGWLMKLQDFLNPF